MNLYTTITDRILKQLDAGVVPWRKTWTTGLPKSMKTGKEYRGINILVLGSQEHSSRYWVTFRQALNLGGHIRKGERATPVIYWKWRTPEELAQRREQGNTAKPAPCVPFTSAVFNLDQVEGVAPPEDDLTTEKKADRLATGIVIAEAQGRVPELLIDARPDRVQNVLRREVVPECCLGLARLGAIKQGAFLCAGGTGRRARCDPGSHQDPMVPR